MSKEAPVQEKRIGIVPEDFAAIIEALRAPTTEQVRAKEEQLAYQRDSALRAKAETERLERTQAICPHKMDIGMSEKSALVHCSGMNDTTPWQFIICQCCGKKIFPTDPEWTSFIVRLPRR